MSVMSRIVQKFGDLISVKEKREEVGIYVLVRHKKWSMKFNNIFYFKLHMQAIFQFKIIVRTKHYSVHLVLRKCRNKFSCFKALYESCTSILKNHTHQTLQCSSGPSKGLEKVFLFQSFIWKLYFHLKKNHTYQTLQCSSGPSKGSEQVLQGTLS